MVPSTVLFHQVHADDTTPAQLRLEVINSASACEIYHKA
jgi:hypothetical protein